MNSFILGFWIVSAILPLAQGSGDGRSVSVKPEDLSVCELRNTQLGLVKEVRIRVVYRVGFEWAELYSLKCPDAPRVWVDFSKDWESHARRAVRKEIEKGEGTYGVIFAGKLIKGSGFGHMGAYPMKLEVTSVESAQRIDKQSYSPNAVTPEMRRRIEVFEARP
jgi:hypothetical protein